MEKVILSLKKTIETLLNANPNSLLLFDVVAVDNIIQVALRLDGDSNNYKYLFGVFDMIKAYLRLTFHSDFNPVIKTREPNLIVFTLEI